MVLRPYLKAFVSGVYSIEYYHINDQLYPYIAYMITNYVKLDAISLAITPEVD